MWLDDFESELSQWYDAPSEYLRMAGLFTAGAALAHRVYVHSPKRTTTNLYVVLLGPPGSGKSTILLEGVSMLEKIISSGDILPVHASAEALERQVAKYAGEGGKHGLLVYDEFQSFIQHIRKEYASNVGNIVLERFQEGVTLVTARTADKGRIEKMTVPGHFLMSFSATDVPHRFASSLKEADAMGGLLSRVLICEGGVKPKDFGGFPPPSNPDIMAWLTETLKWIREQYVDTVFEFDEEAKIYGLEVIHKLRTKIRNSGNEFYISATARIESYLKKIALLYAAVAVRGDNVIWKEDIEKAEKILTASVGSLYLISEEFHLGEGHYAKSFIRVKRILIERGSVTRGDLLRMVAIKPKELDEIFESLHEQELIRFDRDADDVYVTWEGQR